MELPVPFDDLTEADHSGVVAWLRFIEEKDGRGIRAALFETSGQGEPLAFCFTRVDRRGPSLRHQEGAGQVALTSLAKTLFQSAPWSPTLVLGLADEMPWWMFNGDIRVRLPFCRVSLDEALTGASSECGGPACVNVQPLLWETEQPAPDSAARRLLDEMVERDNPYEPFQRAAEGLAEAFADQRVQAMTAVSGITTVVSLESLPQRPEYAPTTSPAAAEAVQTFMQEDRPGLTLAERLWWVLRAPSRLPAGALGAQLTWPGELMPFQRVGVQALLENDRLLLADDYGAEKDPAGHRRPADPARAGECEARSGGGPSQPPGPVAA